MMITIITPKNSRDPAHNPETPRDTAHTPRTHARTPNFPAQKNTPKPDRKIHLLKGPQHPEKPRKSGQGLQTRAPGPPGPPPKPPFWDPPKTQFLAPSPGSTPQKGPFWDPGLGYHGGAPGGPRGAPGPRNWGFLGGVPGGPKIRDFRGGPGKFPGREIPAGKIPGARRFRAGENLARGYF